MNALATVRSEDEEQGFDFSHLRVFSTIPRYHHDVVVMRGLVVVFDTECLSREGIQIGGLYVRECQRPPSSMQWEAWLKSEWEDRNRRCGPFSRLTTSREVVQAVNHPRPDSLSLRLASGHVDGPFHSWAFGMDIIGKVVGLYLPTGKAA